MATVEVFNKNRSKAIEDAAIASADIDVNGHLILTRVNGTTFDAGHVVGAQGEPGTDGTFDTSLATVSPDANKIVKRTSDGRAKAAPGLVAGDIAVYEQVSRPNLIINGAFRTNQRGYVSGTYPATADFSFDRWRHAYNANTSLTFSTAPQGQMITIGYRYPSTYGVIRQIIERGNIKPGYHVLSWEGSAFGRVDKASNIGYAGFSASPQVVYLDGSEDVSVEFITPGTPSAPATLGNVKLEYGSTPTPFILDTIDDELRHCQRYYEKSYDPGVKPGTAIAAGATMNYSIFTGGTSSYIQMGIKFLVPKRVVPTITVYDTQGNPGKATRYQIGVGLYANQDVWGSDLGKNGLTVYSTGSSATGMFAHWVADAEM